MASRYEIVEHTADVGVRGIGDSPEEAFEGAAEGFASLLGVWFPGEGEARTVGVEAPDREALLVAWLDELLFIQEAEGLGFGGFSIAEMRDKSLRADVMATPLGDRSPEGIGVKAATYHQLRVAEEDDGTWVAQAILDV